MTWFAVGSYYYATKYYEIARTYFSKATTKDVNFGPAWIGFAHAFAVEVCAFFVTFCSHSHAPHTFAPRTPTHKFSATLCVRPCRESMTKPWQHTAMLFASYRGPTSLSCTWAWSMHKQTTSPLPCVTFVKQERFTVSECVRVSVCVSVCVFVCVSCISLVLFNLDQPLLLAHHPIQCILLLQTHTHFSPHPINQGQTLPCSTRWVSFTFKAATTSLQPRASSRQRRCLASFDW